MHLLRPILVRPSSIIPHILSITPSPRIKLLTILIPHLPATLPSPILPSLRKPFVQIRPYDPLIQFRAANIQQAVQRVLVRIVLDEAEAAWCFVEAVQAHDETFDLAAFAEEFVDLFFGGVEQNVPQINKKKIGEFGFEVGRFGAGCFFDVGVVAGARVTFAFLVLEGC